MGKNHPDADLHPEATGPAAAIVKGHQAENPLKLYSGWFCPFVQRVWIALEEKNLSYQYIEVNPYHKPQSLLDLNPRGLVPTLQYDNKPLYESTVLCEFLDEAYPDSKQLMPKDPYDRARTRIWTDYVGSRIVPSYHRFLQHQGKDGLQDKQTEFLNHLKEFTREMDSTGPYFLGRILSLIDIVLAPWAVRLWVFDHFKSSGLGIPEEGKGGPDEEVWKRWRKWVKAIEERMSVKGTMSEREHYLPIYQRYAEDRAQSEAAKAIRAGRGIP